MSGDGFTGHRLPPFPVDDGTLGLLWAALHPGPHAERTSLWDFLRLMSELGGSDPLALADEQPDEQATVPGQFGDTPVVLMRDQAYTDHCVISALIDEVRRLRTEGGVR